jgi:hypothetical protein
MLTRLYSELPDVLDPHASRLLCEAFSLYGASGHHHHVLFLDRASGTDDEMVYALTEVLRVVRSYRGTVTFITRRKDMYQMLERSGLGREVHVLRHVRASLRTAEPPLVKVA